MKDLINKFTPIDRVGDIWVKRDDFFCIAGVNGGKVRSCFNLMQKAKGVTTAGSRKSPQINIVASIAQLMGIPFYAHCPQGDLGEELIYAKNKGATIIQHKAGYNSVIKARARGHANQLGFLEVPFGMMCDTAIEETRKQVENFPNGIKRIIMPVGSGMSLAGVLNGLKDKKLNIPVLGVVVGASPERALNAFAPMDWRSMVTLVNAGVDYHVEIKENSYNGILLDPIYEAKVIKFIEKDDLFWIVGLRESIAKNTGQNLSS